MYKTEKTAIVPIENSNSLYSIFTRVCSSIITPITSYFSSINSPTNPALRFESCESTSLSPVVLKETHKAAVCGTRHLAHRDKPSSFTLKQLVLVAFGVTAGVASGTTLLSGTPATITSCFAALDRAFTFPGANAQIINNSTYPKLLFYTNQPNSFSIPFTNILGAGTWTSSGLQSWDSSVTIPASITYTNGIANFSISGTPGATDRGLYYLKNNATATNGTQFTSPMQLSISEQIGIKNNKPSESTTGDGTLFQTSFYPTDLFRYNGVTGYLVFSLKGGGALPSWLQMARSSFITSSYASGTISSIAIAGTLLYVGSPAVGGIQALDITTPGSPLPKGVYAGGYNCFVLRGSLVYYGDVGSVGKLDFTNPTSPVWLTATATTAPVYGLSSYGSYIYAGNGVTGMLILDTSLALKSTYNTPGSASNIKVVNSLAYIADGTSVQIVNVGVVTAPFFVGSFTPPGTVYDIAIAGPTAYVATSTGIYSYDITSSAAPILLGSFPTAAIARGITINGIFAYVSLDAAGTLLLDISNPSAMISRGTHSTQGNAYATAISGTWAYTASGTAGIEMVNYAADFYTITGNPTSGNAGNLAIQVAITNDVGATQSSPYSLRVEGPPVPNSAAISFPVAFAGLSWSAIVPQNAFSDPNFDALSLSATLSSGTSLPSWLNFQSGLFIGTPPASAVGNLSIRVFANDGHNGVAYFDTSLTIANLPQIASPIPTQLAQTNQPVSFVFPAGAVIDPSGGSLTYSASGVSGLPLPTGFTFNAATRTLTGTFSQTGQYTIDFKVAESHGGSVDAFVQFNVGAPPQVVGTIPNAIVAVGSPFQITLPNGLFSSPTGLGLTYTAVDVATGSAPAWATFNPSTLQFKGTPPTGSGPITIKVTATDSLGFSASTTFKVTPDQYPTVNPNYLSGPQAIGSQVVQDGQPWSFTLPSDLFVGNNATLSVTTAGGTPAPSWITLVGNTLSGTPNGNPSVTLTITGTDPLGGSGTFSLNLLVSPFPQTAYSPTAVTAPIGNAFTYAVSTANIFTYKGNDPLTYTVQQVSSSALTALPGWLSFKNGVLVGTPLLATDAGALTLSIKATNNVGGSATALLPILVTYIPSVGQLVPSLQARVAPLPSPYSFQYKIPNTTIIDLSGTALSYNLTNLTGSALGTWCTFNALTGVLSGRPKAGHEGTTVFVYTGSNARGSANVQFSLVVSPNQAPTAGKLSVQYISVKDDIIISIPQTLITDPDGDAITRTVTMNGKPLPSWITFDDTTGIFKGKAPRSATGIFDSKDYEIDITATDGDKTVITSFILRVGGDSTFVNGFTNFGYAMIPFSLLGATYTVWSLRKRFWRLFCGCMYKNPPVGAVVGQKFSYQLHKETATVALKPLMKGSVEEPIQFIFQEAVMFNRTTKMLEGIPTEDGDYTLIARDSAGKRRNQFRLLLGSSQELSNANIKSYSDPVPQLAVRTISNMLGDDEYSNEQKTVLEAITIEGPNGAGSSWWPFGSTK